jgi:hypothetical protein
MEEDTMSPDGNESHQAGASTLAGVIREELRGRAEWVADVRSPINWQQLHAELEIAEDNSHIGRTLPAAHPYRGLKRLAATCVLFLARVVTSRQHAFNMLILSPLRTLAAAVQRIDAEQTRLAEQAVARLERLAVEQEARIRRLEEALARAQAGPVESAPAKERSWDHAA